MSKYILILLAIISLYACRDTTTIGSDLLDDEVIDFETVTFDDLKVRTLLSDSIVTKNDGSNFFYYLLGEVEDDVFGHYSADIYLALNKITSFNYTDATVDSVVLTMYYDTLRVQGDTLQDYHVHVYELDESFIDIETIYSNQSFEASNPLADIIMQPRPSTSTKVYRNDVDSIVTLSPHLRIPLSNEFGERLLVDSTLTSEEFSAKYHGFKVTAETQGIGGLMSFTLSDAINSAISYNNVELYITDSNGEQFTINYPFSSHTFNHFNHDYSNTSITEDVDNDFLYVQSMAGPQIEVDLSEIKTFGDNQLLNQAQLLLVEAVDIDNDPESLFAKNDYFYAYQINEDGEKEFIKDVSKASSNSLNQYIDGNLKERDIDSDMLSAAAFNITDFVKEFSNGENNGKLYIVPVYPNYNAKRSVFYGTNNVDYAPRLTLTYTNI